MAILRHGGGHRGSGEADEKPCRSTNTEIPITCHARVASQPAGSIAFTRFGWCNNEIQKLVSYRLVSHIAVLLKNI
jgi:hypothetical protein